MKLHNGYIEGANLARIMGALGIVLFHFSCYCAPLKPYLYETVNSPWGKIWVALFFALSGACVVRSNTDSGVLQFYKKRWLSVFPMFFLAYLVVFAMKLAVYGCWWKAINLWTIPLTLIGMDSYFYYIQPNFSCVGEWFIGALLVCYMLFPLLRKALQYMPYTAAAVLIIGSFFIPYLPWFIVEPWHNIWVCATIFYIGMLLAQFPAVFISKISFAIATIMSIVMFIVPLPLKQYAAISGIWYPILSGLFLCVMLIHIGSYIERPQRLKKVLSYMGELSYPIFLIQHVVIFAILDKWATPTLPVAVQVIFMDVIITWLSADLLLVMKDRFSEKSLRHNA